MGNFNTHLRRDQIIDALNNALSSVQPDDLASVATSGRYADLLGKPIVDESPTEDSENIVSSGGVANAIKVIRNAVAGQIDGGAKNRLTINSGSNTPPTRWINIPVSIAPGTYHVFFGNLASDDTDAEKCQACFLDSANTQVSNWLSFERGTDVSAVATLTGAAITLRLYPSDSYAHSEGDTVTFTDGMVCAESDWAISQEYAPYCPTMPELYQMILDLGGGNRSMQVEPEQEVR
jgi:hypothetical protein